MMATAPLCAALLVGLFGSAAALAESGIAGSPHNLSGRAAAEAIEICAFCHVPEMTGAPDRPRWSHSDVAPGGYTAYASPADAESIVAKPSGVSLVCLSCHDAVIAMDVPLAAESAFVRFGRVPIGAGGFWASHPVSVSYEQGYDPAFNRPTRGKVGDLPLFRASGARDPGSRVECPSCHNPHEIVFGKFLRISNGDSALCRNCHNR
jgi:predicted CXXCH cytochrome family protein